MKNFKEVKIILLFFTLFIIISCRNKITGKLLSNIQGLPKKAIYNVQIYPIKSDKLEDAFDTSKEIYKYLENQKGFLDMSVFTDQKERIVVFLAWKDYESSITSEKNFYKDSDLGPKLLSYCNEEPTIISVTNRRPYFIGKGKIKDNKLYIRLISWSFKKNKPLNAIEMGQKIFKWYNGKNGFVGMILFNSLGDSNLPNMALQIFDSPESMQQNIYQYDHSEVGKYFFSFYVNGTYTSDLRLIPLNDFIEVKSTNKK